MRERLTPWWREIAGPRAWIAVPAGALLAAALALDPALEPEDGLGTYLAYAALLPVAIFFRLGRAIDRRRRDGLEAEEALRDPSGARAASAGVVAACLALLAGLAVFAIPPLALELAAPGKPPPAMHPVRVAADGESAWSFDAGGPVQPGTHLLLAFTWERFPEGATWTPRGVPLEPGATARVPLDEAECASGRVRGGLDHAGRAAGGELIRPLARFEVPRPAYGAAPLLLAAQFLFAFPLLALVFVLARGLRVGGSLAALTATALAGLLLFDPVDPPRLGDGPADLVARGVLALRDLLPDLRGLAPIGRGYELRLRTTGLASLLPWLLLGWAPLRLCRRLLRRAP